MLVKTLAAPNRCSSAIPVTGPSIAPSVVNDPYRPIAWPRREDGAASAAITIAELWTRP